MTQKSLGLALGSGGSRGFAHIGVIQALVENNIKIDYIAGASAGALVGGMYAATQDIYKVRSILEILSFRTILELAIDPEFRSGGVIAGRKVINYLHQQIGKVNIEDLPIKFSAVSTDVQTGETYIHDKGDLATAIRCSGSIPFVLKPYKIQGKILIDGGASMPVPTELVNKMGADVTIAVNLDSAFFSKIKKRFLSSPSAIDTLRATGDLFRFHLAQENCKNADVCLDPGISSEIIKNLRKPTKVIQRGYDVTMEKMEEIKKLLY